MQIKFQTAWITGSSRGLGKQIAVKLATEGSQENRRSLSDREVRGGDVFVSD
jgi:NAD(P)-dependent dehydrogenase (short-subunit alcohol dehydrogenase family)